MPNVRTRFADAPCRMEIRCGVCRWSSAVTAVLLDRRPVGAHRQRRRCKLCERLIGIDYLAAHYRQHGFKTFDLIFRNRKVVGGQHSQIRQLARSERSLLAVLRRKPTAADSIQTERLHPFEAVILLVERGSADGFASDEPV